MQRAIRDRMARSTFAAGIIAVHLLLAYFLIVPLRKLTSALPNAGEAMVLLQPGEVRNPAPAVESPPEVEPQLEEPEVVYVPAPALDIRESGDVSRRLSSGAIGAGRPEMPSSLASEAGIAVLQRVLPHYPIESVRAGEEGSAVLQVLVDESGRASEVRVARSTGFQRLDDAAVGAVKLWKFAPSMKGPTAVATWGEMELRFELYRFTLSRIVDAPLDLVPLGQILNARGDGAVPGGDSALRALMREIRLADADAFDAPWLRDELKRMQGALRGWGEATVIQYAGSAAGARWRTYQVRPEFRKGNVRDTVELRWDIYRVAHDRGASEWRVALDRNGAIWAAHAGAVRP